MYRYIAAGQPTLRRAAAATLRNLCERDAAAVAAAAGYRGGLEADLLALLVGGGVELYDC